MSKAKYALLIDVASIQKYIFGSNKLAENIGASYIIENLIFEKSWLNEQLESEDKIGYIGGGNALLLFEDMGRRTEFVKNFRKKVLNAYPGIRIYFGSYDDFNDKEGFQESMKALHSSLRKSKMLNGHLVETYKHGIVQECKLSNGVAESEWHNEWISQSSKVKLEKSKKSNDHLNEKYKGSLNGRWVFTTEIEYLGQPSERSYVAVVHIDGNGIGQQFRESNSLKQTQELSNSVRNLSQNAMNSLIKEVVRTAETLQESKQFHFRNEGKRTILPIRPIIAGGDDFTFVCEGKLGLFFANELIRRLSNDESGVGSKRITACGGVAIVHTKFPFSKAYKLAEDLCQKAKTKSRDNPGNYLSFMISRDGLAEGLDEIIEQNFTIKGESFFQVYQLEKNDSFSALIRQLYEFNTDASWSNSRMMELRSALYGSKNDKVYFQEKFNTRKKTEKELKILNDNKVILHDAIELYNFYPLELLMKKNKASK